MENSDPPLGDPQGNLDDVANAAMPPRDISLLNVAVAAAQDRTDELRAQVSFALASGITPQEIVDILDQAALHTGRSHEHQLIILGDAIRDAG
jgi:alkylhydroperoxidase/carboxymuconolactone decarboxylase family protein YurZ